MPKSWDKVDPLKVTLEQSPVNIQRQERRAKEHVTIFHRIATSEGAGRGIIKQTFTECAKETRNEPVKEERNRIISECMKNHKKEFGTPGLNVRESRGKFKEMINGRPGLKGTYLVNGIENGERINEVDARLIRSGQPVHRPTYLEMSPAVGTNSKLAEETEVALEVKALLCEYDEPMSRYQKAIEAKDYAGSAIIEQEMRDISDCEACHAIIDQVVEDAVKWSDCTENCDALLKAFQATIVWAKDALCPDRHALHAGQE